MRTLHYYGTKTKIQIFKSRKDFTSMSECYCSLLDSAYFVLVNKYIDSLILKSKTESAEHLPVLISSLYKYNTRSIM